MTKRDLDRLDQLLIRLTEHFLDDRSKQMTRGISRGEARAIVAAIRELKKS